MFSVVGQYISEGMAQAMAEVFRRVSAKNIAQAPRRHIGLQEVEEEKLTYIPIKEINLDDNGLKDTAFAHILSALATQPTLKRIIYINNEIGARSI